MPPTFRPVTTPSRPSQLFACLASPTLTRCAVFLSPCSSAGRMTRLTGITAPTARHAAKSSSTARPWSVRRPASPCDNLGAAWRGLQVVLIGARWPGNPVRGVRGEPRRGGGFGRPWLACAWCAGWRAANVRNGWRANCVSSARPPRRGTHSTAVCCCFAAWCVLLGARCSGGQGMSFPSSLLPRAPYGNVTGAVVHSWMPEHWCVCLGVFGVHGRPRDVPGRLRLCAALP